MGLDGVVFLTKIRKKDKKFIFILVGKPEVKRLLEDLAINRRTVIRQILAVVWQFGYDVFGPRQSAVNILLTFGFRKT